MFKKDKEVHFIKQGSVEFSIVPKILKGKLKVDHNGLYLIWTPDCNTHMIDKDLVAETKIELWPKVQQVVGAFRGEISAEIDKLKELDTAVMKVADYGCRED